MASSSAGLRIALYSRERNAGLVVGKVSVAATNHVAGLERSVIAADAGLSLANEGTVGRHDEVLRERGDGSTSTVIDMPEHPKIPDGPQTSKRSCSLSSR